MARAVRTGRRTGTGTAEVGRAAVFSKGVGTAEVGRAAADMGTCTAEGGLAAAATQSLPG